MFNLSPKCDVALRSFLCLHLFGVCDGNSLFLTTGATCSLVRDEVCEREWREIDALISPQDCQHVKSYHKEIVLSVQVKDCMSVTFSFFQS